MPACSETRPFAEVLRLGTAALRACPEGCERWHCEHAWKRTRKRFGVSQPKSATRNEGLVAAEPANSVGAGADLEPLVLSIQNPQLSAVVNGEGGGGFGQRAIAHYRLAGNDNGGASKAGFAQGGGNGGTQKWSEYGKRKHMRCRGGLGPGPPSQPPKRQKQRQPPPWKLFFSPWPY